MPPGDETEPYVIGRLFLETPGDPEPPDTRNSTGSIVSWLNSQREKRRYGQSADSESPLHSRITCGDILEVIYELLTQSRPYSGKLNASLQPHPLPLSTYLRLDLTKGPEGFSLRFHRDMEGNAVGRSHSEIPTNIRTWRGYRSPVCTHLALFIHNLTVYASNSFKS